jgi:hypothetical protein
MMATIVLFASTSAVVASAGRDMQRGVVSALAVIGLGMLISCTAVVSYAEIFSPGNPNAPADLMFENTAMHLTAPLLLALVVSLIAIALSKEGARHRFRVSVLISLAAFPFLITGIVLLVYAASLPRVDRPIFVLPGMAVSMIALSCLPCFLGRTEGRRTLSWRRSIRQH